MYLPVLLVRDYGLWGLVVFAVPNVIGAASLAWVLPTPERAARLLEQHEGMCRAFSLVTLAFHAYFLAMMRGFIDGHWWEISVALAFIVVAAAGLGRRRSGDGAERWIASGVLAVSLGLGAALAADGTPDALSPPPAPPAGDGVLWLAPICCFGFALCPYLDLTFLHARARTGTGRGRKAFGLGFGVLFAAMIVVTLLYAPFLGTGRIGALGPITLLLLAAHLSLQLAFTAGVHVRRLVAGRARVLESLWFIAPLLAGLLGGSLRGLVPDAALSGLATQEVVYRAFMAFYGLVFPAYVWLCMIPTPDGHSGLGGAIGRRKLLVWCAAVGVAMPCFWMGFIAREEAFLAPGLLVVLLARLPVRARQE